MISKITLVVILLFLLPGCRGYNNISPWIEESTSPRCSAYWSSRKVYPSSSMGMEIVTDQCDTRVYLNLMICPVQPDDQTIHFDFWIDDISYQGKAYVLKGGQRLLLDDTTSQIILEAIDTGKEISVSVGMYIDQNFVSF